MILSTYIKILKIHEVTRVGESPSYQMPDMITPYKKYTEKTFQKEIHQNARNHCLYAGRLGFSFVIFPHILTAWVIFTVNILVPQSGRDHTVQVFC